MTSDMLAGVGSEEERAALAPFLSFAGLKGTIKADLRANPREIKTQAVLIWFRLCQYLMRDHRKPRALSFPAVALYRLVTEFVLGIELRPKTRVGPGLRIFHGTGLVVNDHALIGSGVTLRNGVVIGNKRAHGGCPFISDSVEVGAAALIIGDIFVGAGALIGAGAVVVKDVAARDAVAGNPARSIVRG